MIWEEAQGVQEGGIAENLVSIGVSAGNIYVYERFDNQLQTVPYAKFLPEGAHMWAAETSHLSSSTRIVNHMSLSLVQFAAQIQFLKRYWELLPVTKAVERLRAAENDHIAVAITFDDGYRDNAWAVEYLRYFGVPATFFISTGHVRDGSAFAHFTATATNAVSGATSEFSDGLLLAK